MLLSSPYYLRWLKCWTQQSPLECNHISHFTPVFTESEKSSIPGQAIPWLPHRNQGKIVPVHESGFIKETKSELEKGENQIYPVTKYSSALTLVFNRAQSAISNQNMTIMYHGSFSSDGATSLANPKPRLRWTLEFQWRFVDAIIQLALHMSNIYFRVCS